MEIHFVYAGEYYFAHPKNSLKKIIHKEMQKYEIKKVMLTEISMERQKLITKEKMMKFCNGEEYVKESVNDDLDSLFENIQVSKKMHGFHEWSYFLPMLTKEELKLVEIKDEKFMNTFRHPDPDVKQAEMTASESKSKFVYAECRRRTYQIKNLKRKTSSSI